MATKIINVCDNCGASKEYGIERFYMTRDGSLYVDTNDVDPEKCKQIDLCWTCICKFLEEAIKLQKKF